MKSIKPLCLLLILLPLLSLTNGMDEKENELNLFVVHTIENENSTQPEEIDIQSIKLYEPKFVSKIVGGYVAKDYQFPYQAAIYIFGYSGRVLFCGGSIISKEYVITAAHCIFEKPKRILVILGTNILFKYNRFEVRRDVQRYIIHKNFDHDSLKHDICLLHLRGALIYTKSIAPIALPNISDINRNYLHRTATVSGFGKRSDGGATSKRLMYIYLDIMDNKECNNWFDDRDATYTNICTSGLNGHGACQGDSGGPLVIDNKLIGLVSYGAIYCSWGYPSVYTRVSSYIKWISNYTKIPIH